MKNPRRFSRLVDLRPVEPSRGPSLVKVNTSSRQCIGVRAPLSIPPSHLHPTSSSSRASHEFYFSPSPFSLKRSFAVFVSLSVTFFPRLESRTIVVCLLPFCCLVLQTRIIPSPLIPYASNSYDTFDSSA